MTGLSPTGRTHKAFQVTCASKLSSVPYRCPRFLASVHRRSRCPSSRGLGRGQRHGKQKQWSPSYLVDILRYTVHLVGPGHPWSVRQNHRLDFLWRRCVVFSEENTTAGGKRSWRWGISVVSLQVRGRDELVWPWDPCFYRKVLHCAHTGSPRSQSVGATLGWSAEADSLLIGMAAAFRHSRKYWNYEMRRTRTCVKK